MEKSAFPEQGHFYKGNIHSHSVISDGNLTVEQIKNAYKSQGYSFVLVSDHNISANHGLQLNDSEFIALQGFEGNMLVERNGPSKEFHFCFLKKPNRYLGDISFNPYPHLTKVESIPYTGDSSLQEYLDRQLARGYMAIFNHPYWSYNTEQDLICLCDRIIGVEIFNSNCEVMDVTGSAHIFYDMLLRKGHRLFAFAADDSHNDYPLDSVASDSFGSFIVVKAPSLCEEDIVTAIYEGSFYASQGPEIYQFYLDSDEAVVSCSPACKVYITSDRRNARLCYDNDGKLTSCRMKIDTDSPYIRAVVVDSAGRKAYSNPIWL